MREALENDLRAVLNGALNMLGTVERMLPVAGDVLLRENVERLAEVKALDRDKTEPELAKTMSSEIYAAAKRFIGRK